MTSSEMDTPAMKLDELLASLTDAERDFIAALDYGMSASLHRQQLDLVIANHGLVEMKTQYWYPYEVIELGKNYLQAGHEREFTACFGMVLRNIGHGVDGMNSINAMLAYPHAAISFLPPELAALIEDLVKDTLKQIESRFLDELKTALTERDARKFTAMYNSSVRSEPEQRKTRKTILQMPGEIVAISLVLMPGIEGERREKSQPNALVQIEYVDNGAAFSLSLPCRISEDGDYYLTDPTAPLPWRKE